jgi:hypothetical protein
VLCAESQQNFRRNKSRPLKVNRLFGGTCRLHLRGRSKQETRTKHVAGGSARYLRQAGVLLGLFFDPKDGGDMILQNVG